MLNNVLSSSSCCLFKHIYPRILWNSTRAQTATRSSSSLCHLNYPQTLSSCSSSSSTLLVARLYHPKPFTTNVLLFSSSSPVSSSSSSSSSSNNKSSSEQQQTTTNTSGADLHIRIEQLLKKHFQDANEIVVKDISGGCGYMFEVFVSSRQFQGLSKVKQHLTVSNILKEEIKDMHGIRIFTEVPTTAD